MSGAPNSAAGAAPARALPGSGDARRHLIVAIVNNRPGVLNRVASLMRARNFNIESLAVSVTERSDTSRMTLTIFGDEVHVEQATKQLYKLIDVLKVEDVTDSAIVEHELALIKVRVTSKSRPELVSLAEMHHGRVVDLGDDAVIVEIVGEPSDVDRVVELLREFGIKELVRTGSVVMARGSGSIEEQVKR
jgi:acetolactate synthase-1/3 small subunit